MVFSMTADQHPLAAARDAAGLSQDDLAKAAKVGLHIIKALETNRQKTTATPRVERIIKVLSAYDGVNVDDVRVALAGRTSKQEDKLRSDVDDLARQVHDLRRTVKALVDAVEKLDSRSNGHR